jgi:hypothetical protein
MKTQQVEIAKIITDAGTQSRAEISTDTVSDYAERMDAGDCFPPVILFFDGTDYFLADGFHRLNAAALRAEEQDTIEADVRQGTRLDAVMFALRANDQHGLRRTNADKRHCVGIALTEFAGMSDRGIAEMCGVSAMLVGSVRVAKSSTCKILTPEILTPETRTGKDGKEYPVKQSTSERQVGFSSQTPIAGQPAGTDSGGTQFPSRLPSESASEKGKPQRPLGTHNAEAGGKDSVLCGRTEPNSHTTNANPDAGRPVATATATAEQTQHAATASQTSEGSKAGGAADRPPAEPILNSKGEKFEWSELTPATARAMAEEMRIPEQVNDDAANLSMLKLYWRRTGNVARHEFLRWVNGTIEARVA